MKKIRKTLFITIGIIFGFILLAYFGESQGVFLGLIGVLLFLLIYFFLDI